MTRYYPMMCTTPFCYEDKKPDSYYCTFHTLTNRLGRVLLWVAEIGVAVVLALSLFGCRPMGRDIPPPVKPAAVDDDDSDMINVRNSPDFKEIFDVAECKGARTCQE